MSSAGCEEFRELEVEFALGILPGRERMAALAHLSRCPACRSEADHLSALCDGLVDLLPGANPPPGFDRAVAAHLGDLAHGQPASAQPTPGQPAPGQPASGEPVSRSSEQTPRRPSRPRLVAAAALIAVAAGISGWAVGTTGHQRPTPVATGTSDVEHRVLEARFVSGHPVTGYAFAYYGDPSWVFMTVHASGGLSRVSCRLLERNGTNLDGGTVTLTHGSGYWGVPLPVAAGALASAELVGPHGEILGRAAFSAS